MARLAALATLAIGLLAAAPASAHFKLQEPQDWLQTDDTGDPAGLDGTQKMNPCGDGTESGLVTQVHAGATLHVKLTETVAHGGHYRIALLPKYAPTSDELPEPKVTLASGSCSKADVMSPVAPPVLADGLFDHTQAEFGSGKVWETDVTLPADTGEATLQVIEFMTPHAPQCFYHHCARLQIVDASVDLGSDGYKVVSAGTAPPEGSSSGDAGAPPSPGGSGGSGGSSGGCAVASGTPSLVTSSLAMLALVAMLRPRRRR